MTRRAMTWRRALRATAAAVSMLVALAFAAGNFVLVDVRLFTVGFETRLAWAVLLPVLLAFGAGVLWARTAVAKPAPAQHEP